MKNFNLEKYIDDFKQISFSIGYSFDNADDQPETLNKTIIECIKCHVPLKRSKVTHRPAPWMEDPDILVIQNQRYKLRYKAHSKRAKSVWGIQENKKQNQTENKYN